MSQVLKWLEDGPCAPDPYRASDLPGIVELFHDTVHALGARHYTQEELASRLPLNW